MLQCKKRTGSAAFTQSRELGAHGRTGWLAGHGQRLRLDLFRWTRALQGGQRFDRVPLRRKKDVQGLAALHVGDFITMQF
jgi:hypothetical protein